MLQVKKYHPDAVVPMVAHPGTDLGFDLYTVEEVVLQPGQMSEVRTGIGVHFTKMAVGFLIKDRSSFAKKRLETSGGVIDAGYTGEIIVFMTNNGGEAVTLAKGQKFAQMIAMPPLTRLPIEVVEELVATERGVGGFGSSDKASESKLVVVPANAI
jgi:dUTP pyrophosphatase